MFVPSAVQDVRLPDAGVPSAGVVRVGLVRVGLVSVLLVSVWVPVAVTRFVGVMMSDRVVMAYSKGWIAFNASTEAAEASVGAKVAGKSRSSCLRALI